MEILAGSSSGADIAAALKSEETALGFGQISSMAMAWFEPANNAVIINSYYLRKSPKMTAILLAHEGTHLQWKCDLTMGTPIPGGGERSPNSIDQEYHAFLNQTLVWEEIEVVGEDESIDSWAALISSGEERAKAFIRAVYWGLPEY
ncbi:MAG: hypothetical protein U9Q24_01515 [Candidatus Ratteibacteria bacterium]|nr:hypothetical protein [Candidatus Ratteibacteria bacterium]